MFLNVEENLVVKNVTLTFDHFLESRSNSPPIDLNVFSVVMMLKDLHTWRVMWLLPMGRQYCQSLGLSLRNLSWNCRTLEWISGLEIWIAMKAFGLANPGFMVAGSCRDNGSSLIRKLFTQLNLIVKVMHILARLVGGTADKKLFPPGFHDNSECL